MADDPVTHPYSEEETLMTHMGHFATIRYDAKTQEFTGKVVSIDRRDTVMFRGRTLEELRQDMAAQLELYEAATKGRERGGSDDAYPPSASQSEAPAAAPASGRRDRPTVP